eukprot:4617192-Prymnesium_polylepis.1
MARPPALIWQLDALAEAFEQLKVSASKAASSLTDTQDEVNQLTHLLRKRAQLKYDTLKARRTRSPPLIAPGCPLITPDGLLMASLLPTDCLHEYP